MCVSVYTSRPDDDNHPWQLFARHKAHYKKIEGTMTTTITLLSLASSRACAITISSESLTDLMFGVKLDSSAPRLLSISSDRTIVSLSIFFRYWH